MKPLEEGGVVDENLNVYGVSRLKIAGESKSLRWLKHFADYLRQTCPLCRLWLEQIRIRPLF